MDKAIRVQILDETDSTDTLMKGMNPISCPSGGVGKYEHSQNTILAIGVKNVTPANSEYLVSIFIPPHSVQRIYEEWDIPINVPLEKYGISPHKRYSLRVFVWH